MWLIIYSIAITIVAVVLAINYLTYKITALTITYFCIDKFREPTKKEIDDYRKKVIVKLLKHKWFIKQEWQKYWTS